jgi:phage baseplate assembly protein W
LDFGIHPVKKDIDTTTDEVAINRALRNLLLTNYFEKPFNPRFGSPIFGMLFEPVDFIVASTIESGIKYAVQNFEPRISLISVQALPDYDNNGYTIRINYSINNATDNRISVFQFFLERIR